VRTLVVGAGATGGYFGGRLLEAGRDVTFLVRPARAEQLRRTGLVLRSRFGDARLGAPTVTAENLRDPFDLVILAVKSYGLDDAVAPLGPAVGPGTAVLPLLNGMRHLDALDRRFGPNRVLGGLCAIAATLGPEGEIVHLNDKHLLVFGERAGGRSLRADAVAELMAPATMVSKASEVILPAMWEKWVMLAALAGITCLMRAAVGDVVVAPAGRELILQILDETAAVATAHGFAPRPAFLDQCRVMLLEPGSGFTASMLRDIERGGPTEGDHVLGDLVARADARGVPVPLLRLAYCHVKAYEERQRREQTTATPPESPRPASAGRPA
jgi:2-dehydropantoate 2-reductase